LAAHVFRPASSQLGIATQSSSVNATIGARAARQPSLRAAAGPLEAPRWITRSARSSARARSSSQARASSADPSSTTITSNESLSIVCAASESSAIARRSGRSRVAITTETWGFSGIKGAK